MYTIGKKNNLFLQVTVAMVADHVSLGALLKYMHILISAKERRSF